MTLIQNATRNRRMIPSGHYQTLTINNNKHEENMKNQRYLATQQSLNNKHEK